MIMGTSIWQVVTKYLRAITNKSKWADIEYFDNSWKIRVSGMSKYIPRSAKSVMDLGCGEMWLKEMIEPSIQYIGVDYKKRDTHTLVCDFNKMQFPDEKVDVIFVSGCLEYVKHPEWFIGQISQHSKMCILSYCTLNDFPNMNERKKYSWKNHLTKEKIVHYFLLSNMHLSHFEKTETNNAIFIFNNSGK